MNLFIAGTLLFAMSIAIIELLIYAYKNMNSPKRAKMRKRLRKQIFVKTDEVGDSGILKQNVLSDISFLDKLLRHVPGVSRIDLLTIQANAANSVAFYLLMAALLFALSFIVTTAFLKNAYAGGIAACLLGALPFLNLQLIKKKRKADFRSQLPEGLDMIARALQAGHSFTTGMKLAADEFNDPLGPEFSETIDEINFGVSVPDALKNMAKRIDCPEIKYFIVAIILQRESGGDLAELLSSLAGLIRDKFKFQGKVRALTAEGRISAAILVGLPFLVLLALNFTSHDYIKVLFVEPAGRFFLVVAGIMMGFGILVIKRIITIEV